MSIPQIPPTILLLNLPASSLVGIDLLTLTSTPKFQGITNLPPGYHFIFAGATATLSPRTGYWIRVPTYSASRSSWLKIFRWDGETEELREVEDDGEVESWVGRLSDAGNRERGEGLLPYDQAPSSSMDTVIDDWPYLTSLISPHLLSNLTNNTCSISTTSCAVQDRENVPGLSEEDLKSWWGKEGEDLKFLKFDLKRSWRDGAVGMERTSQARDRSWALQSLIDSLETSSPPPLSKLSEEEDQGEDKIWGNQILGEFQLTFLMVLLLGNYSCLQEWKRILELVFTCSDLLLVQEHFFVKFLEVLRLQLIHCDDVEGGLFDVSGDDGGFLKKLLRGFRRAVEDVCGDEPEIGAVELQSGANKLKNGAMKVKNEGKEVKKELERLETWLETHWNWQLGDAFLRRGIVELEDGEAVELELDDMLAEDERGEFAPVIVEI